MKLRLRYYIIIGACASMISMLMGCTDDPAEGTEQERTHELRISLGSHQFDQTRNASDMPNDFVLYDHATAQAQIMQIQGYLTFWDTNKWDNVSCIFSYEESDENHIWTSRVPLKILTSEDESLAKYYFYGYMPKGEGEDNVTILPYDYDYRKGAIITLNNLNAVTPNDICVIVGVKGYNNTDQVPDMKSPSRLGVFDYNPGSDGNNLFLLIDHLYAGLQFNMKLATTYSTLRGIKVRSVNLIPENGNSNVIEKVKATVEIVANANGYNPIVPIYSGSGVNIGGEVTYEVAREGTNPESAELFTGEKELTTDFQSFFGCFCPATNTKFTLETEYDVYDRKGNLIREGETAKNSIRLEQSLTAGQIHTVNITVQPTFLYMLSDPDLDNPTFEVSN